MKSLLADDSSEALRARILRHLANEAQPEFSDIRFLRGPADFDPAVPRFLTTYLMRAWS